MSINKGKTLNRHFYELFGVVLNSVDHEKYLGEILSQDLIVLEFPHQLRQH